MKDFAKDIAAVNSIAAVPTILDVVCRTTGMGFAAVARVTEDRWIACSVKDDVAFGLKPGGELKVESTICHEIRQSGEAVIIDHVSEDSQYRDHHTPQIYGLQSYISMPIVLADGRFFGTLCAIDPKPHMLKTPGVIGMFKLFAELIAFHLDTLEKVELSTAALAGERHDSDLREQFIAVLGHDLRNPLAALDSGTRLLAAEPQTPKSQDILALMRNTISRMSGLINDVLDFAQGRLGGGLSLNRITGDPLAPVLEQVASELRASHPGRVLDAVFSIDQPVDCDHSRVGQLFSNLLGNAFKHGVPDEPVVASASTRNGHFELSVVNGGHPIPAEAMPKLFQPFVRGAHASDQQGLGLGLYIAAEIARSHGGALTVTSDDRETKFVFRLPLADVAMTGG